MLGRLIVGLLVLGLACGPLAGCYSMGKATGKTVKAIEKGGDKFKKGYEDGKDK